MATAATATAETEAVMAVSVVAAWARHSAAFRRTAGRRNGQAAGGGRTRRAGGARRRAARVAAGGERRVGRKKRRPGRAHLRPELVEARRRVELGEVGDGDDGVRVAPLTAPAREVARVAGEERAGPAASAARAATGGDALFFEVVLVVGVAVEAFAVAAIVVVVVGIDRRRAGRRRRAAPPGRLQHGAMHGAEREQLDELVVARIGRVRRRPKLQHAVARVGRLVVVVLQPCAAAAAAAARSMACRWRAVVVRGVVEGVEGCPAARASRKRLDSKKGADRTHLRRAQQLEVEADAVVMAPWPPEKRTVQTDP